VLLANGFAVSPWVDIHFCDLRRFRGPYTDRKHRAARGARAITEIYRALAKARRYDWEVLVIRLGEPTPRHDALHSPVQMFVCLPAHEDIICVEDSRLYRERLVLALRPRARRKGRSD
jgi:hypothetical protein